MDVIGNNMDRGTPGWLSTVSAFIDAHPDIKPLLKASFFITIKDYGGVAAFASVTGTSCQELWDCIRGDRLPERETFKKVFPHLLPRMQSIFNWYIEECTKEEMGNLLQKFGINDRADLAVVLEQATNEFQKSSNRQDKETLAQFLNIITKIQLKNDVCG